MRGGEGSPAQGTPSTLDKALDRRPLPGIVSGRGTPISLPKRYNEVASNHATALVRLFFVLAGCITSGIVRS